MKVFGGCLGMFNLLPLEIVPASVNRFLAFLVR